MLVFSTMASVLCIYIFSRILDNFELFTFIAISFNLVVKSTQNSVVSNESLLLEFCLSLLKGIGIQVFSYSNVFYDLWWYWMTWY